jgi:ribA/ribD-fused uncharacterized protein
MPAIIKFKYSNDKYGCFSNFYRKQFVVDGITWKSSEHLYHYKKMKYLQSIGENISDDFIQSIIDADTPKEAKRLGHTKVNNIDKWDKIKVSEMVKIQREKYKYPRFKEILLSTNDAIIVESSYYDPFWGDGGYKQNGKNMMGRILMKIRKELQQEQQDS